MIVSTVAEYSSLKEGNKEFRKLYKKRCAELAKYGLRMTRSYASGLTIKEVNPNSFLFIWKAFDTDLGAEVNQEDWNILSIFAKRICDE